MWPSTQQVIFALFVALQVLACASRPVQLYDGPAQPASDVTAITATSRPNTRIFAVDGERVHGSAFHVVPGSHDVWVHLKMHESAGYANYQIWTYCRFRIDATPGASYELRSNSEITDTGVSGKHGALSAVLLNVADGTSVSPKHCSGDKPRF